ncbi:Neutral ceramidase [Melipona quadrifasciata]|uniref:Neutral ceramidase n=1 Tax=Melipona quadrifasciata TaxID=166423 RepID=A0A0N0BDZ0_9HYME|nr:Neutral ceramidase [Melipona quadrifasciata]
MGHPVLITSDNNDAVTLSVTIARGLIDDKTHVHGCEPAMGYSFAAGTIDGPGSFSFEQGTTSANPMWNTVRNLLATPTTEDVTCHGAKPILLATGRMYLPYEWQPKIVATQVALIGNVVIAGVPAEFTTMSGRRLREAIKTVMNDASDDETSVIVAGLCNTYSDYVTTPEEYQIQRYEGASTIYGPHTLTLYLKEYQELVTATILRKNVDPGPTPPDLRKKNLLTFVTPVLFDTPKWGRNFGDCIKQPQKFATPGDIVSAVFISGHPRNNLMTESSYLTIERLTDDEIWVPVANDASWETKFEWQRMSMVLGSSQVIITWQVPENIKPGEYRIRHNGYYRYILGGIFPYYGVSNHFQKEKVSYFFKWILEERRKSPLRNLEERKNESRNDINTESKVATGTASKQVQTTKQNPSRPFSVQFYENQSGALID